MARSRSQPKIAKAKRPKMIKIFRTAAKRTGRKTPRPKFISN